MKDQLIRLTNSDQFVFRHVCIQNFVMQGQIAKRILSPDTENHKNLTCMSFCTITYQSNYFIFLQSSIANHKKAFWSTPHWKLPKTHCE